MSLKLYVGNLPFSATDEELKTLFSAHGEILSAVVIKDKFSGRSKGFGFVEFSDETAARAAIDALNGQDFNGRNIIVNEAKPMTERSDRGGFGGGSRGGFNRGGDRGGDRGGYRRDRTM